MFNDGLTFLHWELWMDGVTKNSFNGAQYVTQKTIFLTFKFSSSLFFNPTPKTNPGSSNRWETTNSKPLGPIIMVRQSGGSSQILCIIPVHCSQIIFIKLYSLFYQAQHSLEKCQAKITLLRLLFNPI